MLAQFHFGPGQLVLALGLVVILAFCGVASAVFIVSIRHYYRRHQLWRATSDMIMLCAMLSVAGLAVFDIIRDMIG